MEDNGFLKGREYGFFSEKNGLTFIKLIQLLETNCTTFRQKLHALHRYSVPLTIFMPKMYKYSAFCPAFLSSLGYKSSKIMGQKDLHKILS